MFTSCWYSFKIFTFFCINGVIYLHKIPTARCTGAYSQHQTFFCFTGATVVCGLPPLISFKPNLCFYAQRASLLVSTDNRKVKDKQAFSRFSLATFFFRMLIVLSLTVSFDCDFSQLKHLNVCSAGSVFFFFSTVLLLH